MYDFKKQDRLKAVKKAEKILKKASPELAESLDGISGIMGLLEKLDDQRNISMQLHEKLRVFFNDHFAACEDDLGFNNRDACTTAIGGSLLLIDDVLTFAESEKRGDGLALLDSLTIALDKIKCNLEKTEQKEAA